MGRLEGVIIVAGIAGVMALLAAMVSAWHDPLSALGVGIIAFAVVGAVAYVEVSRRRRGSDQ